ncbi:MAG: hypothetical protein JWQ75_1236 [Pseudarthrobacter sp.]|nr:hypothetical protein [Pseudarthrobacter sp.]
MQECSVNRCTARADEVFYVEGPDEQALPVCASHKEIMDSGEDWVLRHQAGNAGHSSGILTLHDVPWRVLAVSAMKVGGNKPGLILHLTLSHSGESKETQLLLPWDEAEVLKGILDS